MADASENDPLATAYRQRTAELHEARGALGSALHGLMRELESQRAERYEQARREEDLRRQLADAVHQLSTVKARLAEVEAELQRAGRDNAALREQAERHEAELRGQTERHRAELRLINSEIDRFGSMKVVRWSRLVARWGSVLRRRG